MKMFFSVKAAGFISGYHEGLNGFTVFYEVAFDFVHFALGEITLTQLTANNME